MKNGTIASGFTIASSVTSGLRSMPSAGLAAAEHAEAFHVQHLFAALVRHLPAGTHQAEVGLAAQRAGLEDRVAQAQRVTGIHRLQPVELVEAGRSHAGGL